MKKGSKYVIRFLQEKWNSDQINGETIQLLCSKTSVSKKVDKKILQKDNTNNKANVIQYHYDRPCELYM